jgi:hypothetical protein
MYMVVATVRVSIGASQRIHPGDYIKLGSTGARTALPRTMVFVVAYDDDICLVL